jgi:hypothetical protein
MERTGTSRSCIRRPLIKRCSGVPAPGRLDGAAGAFFGVDYLVAARIIAIPRRPAPAPACSDAGLLAIAQVRHLLGRRSEAGFMAEVARD